jgi:hypothetical protein
MHDSEFIHSVFGPEIRACCQAPRHHCTGFNQLMRAFSTLLAHAASLNPAAAKAWTHSGNVLAAISG